jgi:hypothetical protein
MTGASIRIGPISMGVQAAHGTAEIGSKALAGKVGLG